MLDLPTPSLIGVIHLAPLPGSSRHLVGMEEIIDRALTDADTLEQAGFDAIVIENFGDAPFHATQLPPASVASMALIADRVRQSTNLPIGINALRNDPRAALGIAAASGASFVRINIHTGATVTDQGLIQGDAANTLNYRKLLGQRIAILADVHVKHGTPLGESDIAQAARDTAYRGLADGLIVTGTATGAPAALEDLRSVRQAVPDRRLFVGSGATAETVGQLLETADGIIVGSGIKIEANPDHPIDPALATAFVQAAGRG
jgi:membrane complex biogenesis BtpA family protein